MRTAATPPAAEARGGNGGEAASFRDPAGFVFREGGILYRQVNRSYGEHYRHLIGSGLYDHLVEEALLVSHSEEGLDLRRTDDAWRVIRPDPIRFISYPYEWCFGQLKDAALLTLRVQELALDADMTLKDASAYNVQFRQGNPVIIDTLSFERYRDGEPWQGYRQFCQHFLGPLALMSHRDVRLGGLLSRHIDGIPLDLTSRLLPLRSQLKPNLLLHLHLHARFQSRFADSGISRWRSRRVSRTQLLGLVDSLRSAVEGLRWRPRDTTWADYDRDESYPPPALKRKDAIVERVLGRLRPGKVLDLGANDGTYSRIAARLDSCVVAVDADPAVVERAYRRYRAEGEEKVLPLVVDLANPTPAVGWGHRERRSLAQRSDAGLVLALALIHHLAIGNNVPFRRIARFFRELGERLLVEFVPHEDPQVSRLLRTRKDVFEGYREEAFVAEFERHFEIEAVHPLEGSLRTLYLMRRRGRS